MVFSSMAVGQHDIFIFIFFDTQIIWLFGFLCGLCKFYDYFFYSCKKIQLEFFIGFAMNLLIHIVEGGHHNDFKFCNLSCMPPSHFVPSLVFLIGALFSNHQVCLFHLLH